MIDSFLDWLAFEGGILWIMSLMIGSVVCIAIAFCLTHECARYETKVTEKSPVYVKVGVALVPLGGSRKEETTCAEWREK